MAHLCTVHPRAPGPIQGLGWDPISLLGLANTEKKNYSFTVFCMKSSLQTSPAQGPYSCASAPSGTRPRPAHRAFSLTWAEKICSLTSGCALVQSSWTVRQKSTIPLGSRIHKTSHEFAGNPSAHTFFSFTFASLCIAQDLASQQARLTSR
jgi:hypothetical protein